MHTFKRDLATTTGALVAYLGLRTLASDSHATALRHAETLLDVEGALRFDVELDAQRAVLQHPGWMDFFNGVYLWAYWPTLVIALTLLRFARADYFYVLRNALVASGLMGLAIMLTYPVAPPRMLAPFVDTIGRDDRQHFVTRPASWSNDYAALPSFHVGWFAMCLAVVAYAFRSRALAVLAVMATALMSAAVVLTANHFVIDVIAGLALSAAGYAVACRSRAWQTTNNWLSARG